MTLVDVGHFILWLALFAAIGGGLWRLIVGPTTLDRMLGFDMITVTVGGLVLVFSAATGSTDYVEFVFILSTLGFLSTVAYFYYLMQLSPTDTNFNPEESP